MTILFIFRSWIRKLDYITVLSEQDIVGFYREIGNQTDLSSSVTETDKNILVAIAEMILQAP